MQQYCKSMLLPILLWACIIGYISRAHDLNFPAPPNDRSAILANGKWIDLENKQYTIGKPSQPKVKQSFLRDSTIFVSIQHYRDARCATTIDSLLKRAKYPDRIHIGTEY